ncbi:MAG: bifunctional diaminohydroxyphosphoribosylaminopyrimidine deaminase/5-amino-6-(5-phosphoribosylamino)uracil reductase RibD [Eudoraea sp.]|nr:bifunctional diaminohydroxyphosphoribosylaminopyrimidine deaminase/5-amino-6-(5-phosphoribosylamino)uracil reductase RibD [Eudoraea sp.]
MKIHEKYMRRCIELGKKALGSAAPNPMVGSVITHQDKIIGEGFTSRYGGPHAEVNAINSVADKSLLNEATLYVTLEPCAHYGKTPPCAELIIKTNLRKVIIGIQDPNKKVSGGGIKKLKEAGIEVLTGVLEDECRKHHKRFLTYQEKHRPYILLKWAETKDGFIAPIRDMRKTKPEPYWISNSYARQRVHQWRSEEQAILVGTNTVLADNPRLDVRFWEGTSPVRIIIDRALKLPADLNIYDKSTRTIILTQLEDKTKFQEGLEYDIIDFGKNMAEEICRILFEKNITSVLVEGGAETLATFVNSGLWDEARIIIGDATFGKGTKAPYIDSKMMATEIIGNNTIKRLLND